MSSFRKAFHKAARYIVIGYAGFAAASAGLALGPRDLTSDDLAESLEKGGLDPAIATQFNNQNIRILHPRNPLTTIMLPAQRTGEALRYLKYDHDQDGDGVVDIEKQGTLTRVIAAPYLFTGDVIDVFHESERAALRGFWWPAARRSWDGQGVCAITTAAPDQIDRRTLTHSLAGIKPAHMRSFENDKDSFSYGFLLLHEATHCDQPVGADSKVLTLANETESDINALFLLRQNGATDEDIAFIKHMRAVSPYSRKVEDTHHATALALDALTTPGTEFPDLGEMYLSNEYLKRIVNARLKHRDTTNEEYAESVYYVMKDILAYEALGRYPLTRRAAEMYVEGFEYLAPNAPAVKNNRKTMPVAPRIPITPALPVPGV